MVNMKASQSNQNLKPANTATSMENIASANIPGRGEGSSVGGDSMADIASSLLIPLHLLKSQHLSHLIGKITVQLNNNNNYPTPPWLMIDSPPAEPQSRTTNELEDVPLDLSVKPTLKVHSPPVPETKPFICGSCGQTFEVHDRLAKHVASRHRNRTPDSAKAYECDVCLRRFSRSDMLTRHSRLHTGFKPYSCSVCGQLFSRSDHLASHQRTHTGEKPYRCPTCPYAACRRDMITRHMKTHSRKQQPA